MTENTESILKILTRPPFTPTIPIGRKAFLSGIIVVLLLFTGISFVYSLVFGDTNIVWVIVRSTLYAYLLSLWMTKRSIDIEIMSSAKKSQIWLFGLILGLQLVNYAYVVMNQQMNAVYEFVFSNGLDSISMAPKVSPLTEMLATPFSIIRALLGLILSANVVYLLLKRTSKRGSLI